MQILLDGKSDAIEKAFSQHLTVPRMLLAHRLFCPLTQEIGKKVVLFNNVVRMATAVEISNFEKGMSSGNSPDSYNYIDLEGFFAVQEYGEYEMINELGIALKESWAAWLPYRHPDFEFETYFDNEEFSNVGFTFSQLELQR